MSTSTGEVVFETERLRVRRMTLADAPFLFELMNQPSWLQFIGDRGIRTLEDAERYLRERVLAMYDRDGFSSFAVELRGTGEVIGSCGLYKRDWFDVIDLGFAYLARHTGQGYAHEAAAALLLHARAVFGLCRLAALTDPNNVRSQHLLKKLGFRFDRQEPVGPDRRDTTIFLLE
jgi:[ribosomal protein S5]-alanine N-acetyltransferase